MQAFMVIGLGFGDEGKGSMVDYLTRLHGTKLVVRFNGGCQAAHNVIGPGGLHHTFAQFGSGTLAGAATHLAPGMLVEPFSLLREADVLLTKGIRDPLANLTIDPECVVTTPYHSLANQARERFRGADKHGSCGRGIGETRSDELSGLALRCKHFGTLEAVRILAEIKRRKLADFSDSVDTVLLLGALRAQELADFYERFRADVVFRDSLKVVQGVGGPIIFEGAQGVLLDERYGTAPNNTWTDCTFSNAHKVTRFIPGIQIVRIGVLRTYATRHGAGPFPSEDAGLRYDEPHNRADGPQGLFRLGHFDATFSRYALKCAGGVDVLALTHLDRFWGRRFTWIERIGDQQSSAAYPSYIVERILQTPVGYESYGPAFDQKLERKSNLARSQTPMCVV